MARGAASMRGADATRMPWGCEADPRRGRGGPPRPRIDAVLRAMGAAAAGGRQTRARTGGAIRTDDGGHQNNYYV